MNNIRTVPNNASGNNADFMAENSSLARVAKLLVTKLCHDLAGPIGALSNGVEFLSESLGDKEMTEKSIGLLELSSKEGSAKLQVARQAFGIINQVGEKSPVGQLKELLQAFLSHNKINLNWQTGNVDQISHNLRQITINLVLIACSALVSGGKIDISLNQTGEKTSVKVRAEGAQIKFDDAGKNILAGKLDADEITPHTIQIYFSTILAKELGAVISSASGDNFLELNVDNLI